MNLLERLEQRPLKVRPKEDYERIVRGLSAADLESMIDLRPFMQRNPFVVQADANLSRTYRLFRTMGLRHLFVSPPQPKVRSCLLLLLLLLLVLLLFLLLFLLLVLTLLLLLMLLLLSFSVYMYLLASL